MCSSSFAIRDTYISLCHGFRTATISGPEEGLANRTGPISGLTVSRNIRQMQRHGTHVTLASYIPVKGILHEYAQWSHCSISISPFYLHVLFISCQVHKQRLVRVVCIFSRVRSLLSDGTNPALGSSLITRN